jgi:hypothetical protein
VVPPFAFLVSAPPKPEPKRESPPEIVLPPDLEGIRQRESGPLVVDISNVMRHGTADRMVLTPKSDGGLALFSPVDVAI